MVAVSSSGEGTDFSLTTNPLDKATGSSPHTLAISSTLILYEGTCAPYLLFLPLNHHKIIILRNYKFNLINDIIYLFLYKIN